MAPRSDERFWDDVDAKGSSGKSERESVYLDGLFLVYGHIQSLFVWPAVPQVHQAFHGRLTPVPITATAHPLAIHPRMRARRRQATDPHNIVGQLHGEVMVERMLDTLSLWQTLYLMGLALPAMLLTLFPYFNHRKFLDRNLQLKGTKIYIMPFWDMQLVWQLVFQLTFRLNLPLCTWPYTLHGHLGMQSITTTHHFIHLFIYSFIFWY